MCFASRKVNRRVQVRSLWATVDGMLTTTEPDGKVLESVLQGDVDQHALDGSGRHLQIPRRLLERMEQPSQQVSAAGALARLTLV